MKPFRIFRPGKHTASCGTAVEFTEEDLKRAVEAYNPQLYAAPLVIGHPKTEDRAYGWAERISYEDGHLVAHPDKVEPQFAELVEQGAYRNRSASWYMPNHPNNPVPGVLYPKHIGFLGAVPPALKGLGDVQFQEEQHPEQVLEFAAVDEAAWGIANAVSAMARLLRRLREQRIEEKGIEDADQLVPDYTIADAEATANALREAASKSAGLVPGFTEPTATPNQGTTTMTPEQIAKLQADHAAAQARLAEFAQRETALAAAEHLATVAAISAQLEPLVTSGRILPASRKTLAEFAATLADDDASRTIEFGEPVDGATPKVSPRAFLLGFLGTLPKSVEYGERGGTGTGNTDGAMTPKQLAAKASELVDAARKEGRHLSFTEATNQVLATSGVEVADPSNGPAV